MCFECPTEQRPEFYDLRDTKNRIMWRRSERGEDEAGEFCMPTNNAMSLSISPRPLSALVRQTGGRRDGEWE